MKNSEKCIKCGSDEVVRFDGYAGPYGVGNNIMVGKSIFSAVNVNRYVCCKCGYSEDHNKHERKNSVLVHNNEPPYIGHCPNLIYAR